MKNERKKTKLTAVNFLTPGQCLNSASIFPAVPQFYRGFTPSDTIPFNHFGTLLRDMEDAFVQTTVWTDFPRPFKAVARNWLGGKQISLTGRGGRGSSTTSDDFTLWRIPRMRKMGVLISRLRISFMRERPPSAL